MEAQVVSVLTGILVLAAVLEGSHNGSENLSLDSTNFANLNSQQKEKQHDNKSREERATGIILEERTFPYSAKEQHKYRAKTTIEFYAENGSGDIYTTPQQSTETTGSPEGSGEISTTTEQSTETTEIPEGSGEISTTISKSPSSTTVVPITSTFPTTSKQPEQCQHGGIFNGEVCVCQSNFFGDQCEFISSNVVLGPNINVAVKVELKITNMIFSPNLADNTSQEYKDFEDIFKAEMKFTYRNMSEYRDVKILNIRNGSIVVEHNVIVEMEYTVNNNKTEAYEALFKNVSTNLQNRNGSCIGGSSTDLLCIEVIDIEPVPVPSTEEICNSIIPGEFQEFFTASLTGTACLSDCNEQSRNYKDCHGGVCQLIANTGASCHCPRKDIYLYTSWHCKDKLLKAGVYGGIGVCISVLSIVIAIMGYFLFKRRTAKKWETLDNTQGNWCDYSDNVWEKGQFYNNFTQYQEVEDNSKVKSILENFEPSLENIDTSIKIKIKRPTIYSAYSLPRTPEIPPTVPYVKWDEQNTVFE